MLFRSLKVPVESSHLSEAAVPRTTLDALSREPLLYRRFQAQNTAATYARYLFTDCKDLIIDRNTPIPYPYASAYLKFHFLQHSQLHSSTTLAWFERLDQSPVGDQASTRALTAAVLFRSDLPSILAVNVRFTEAGSNAFMMRFIRPGTILDRFFRSALRPSDTHCSTLNGFIGMVRASNPSLASTGVSVSGGGTTVT